MTERRTRQYRVTHIPTGIVMVMQGPCDQSYEQVARNAGLRYPVDVTVRTVRSGEEILLPFDEIPLVLRPRVACASS